MSPRFARCKGWRAKGVAIFACQNATVSHFRTDLQLATCWLQPCSLQPCILQSSLATFNLQPCSLRPCSQQACTLEPCSLQLRPCTLQPQYSTCRLQPAACSLAVGSAALAGGLRIQSARVCLCPAPEPRTCDSGQESGSLGDLWVGPMGRLCEHSAGKQSLPIVADAEVH